MHGARHGAAVVVMLAVLAVARPGLCYPYGQSGSHGYPNDTDTANTCGGSGCHSDNPGSYDYSVDVTGLESLLAPDETDALFSIRATRNIGSDAVNAGFNAAVRRDSDGAFAGTLTESNTTVHLSDTDSSQADPHPGDDEWLHDDGADLVSPYQLETPDSNGDFAFTSLGWTAPDGPNASGQYTLHFCVNVVNGNRSGGPEEDANPGNEGDNFFCSTFPVTVDAPPATTGIPGVSTTEDDPDGESISLTSHFSDREDGAAGLNYTVQGNTDAVLVNPSINSNTLSLSFGTDQNGTATVTVRAEDSAGQTVESSFDVSVSAVNDAPVAEDDTGANVPEDSGSAEIDVLPNDEDPDLGEEGDTREVVSVTQPANGTSAVSGSGTGNRVSYQPDANYTGSDSFAYAMEDAAGVPSTATVTVNVTNENDAPNAVNDSATVDEDSGATAIDVLANDADLDTGDTKEVVAVDQPANGSAAIMGTGAGNAVTYTPDADDFGVDRFTYVMEDGAGAQSSATVDVTVNAINDAPTATPGIADVSVNEDAADRTIELDLDFDAVEDAGSLSHRVTGNTNTGLVSTALGGGNSRWRSPPTPTAAPTSRSKRKTRPARPAATPSRSRSRRSTMRP